MHSDRNLFLGTLPGRIILLTPSYHVCPLQLFSTCRAATISSASDPRAAAGLKALGQWLGLVDANLNLTAPNASDIWFLIGALQGHQLGVGAFRLRATQTFLAVDQLDPTEMLALQVEQVLQWQEVAADSFELFEYSDWERAATQLRQDLQAAGLPTLWDESETSAASVLYSMRLQVQEFSSHVVISPDGSQGTAVPVRANLDDLANETGMDAAAYLQGLGDHSLVYQFANVDSDRVERTGYGQKKAPCSCTPMADSTCHADPRPVLTFVCLFACL